MNPQQTLFAHEYLKDGNASAAAIRAGYSPKISAVRGYKLLRNPKVAALIKKAHDERLKRVKLDQDYVIERLMMEAEREGEGSSHSARVAALQHLGKHLAMFTDRTEHSGEVSISGVKVTFERP